MEGASQNGLGHSLHNPYLIRPSIVCKAESRYIQSVDFWLVALPSAKPGSGYLPAPDARLPCSSALFEDINGVYYIYIYIYSILVYVVIAFGSGSFTETLAEWAEAVVTGRARLGGIPVGVVATESRLREKKCPADPADMSSHERIVQQVNKRK